MSKLIIRSPHETTVIKYNSIDLNNKLTYNRSAFMYIIADDNLLEGL